MTERAISERVASQQGQMLDLLAELVTQESGTYDKADVDALGRILRCELEGLDFVVETVPQTQYGDHVVGRRPSRNGRSMLLVGHMDTVFPHGTIRERPFRVEAGRAYGPGVFDMKGGIVIMLAALRALRDASAPAFADTGITVFLNGDEEVLSPTSSPLIVEEARRAHLACVLEPCGPNGGYVFVRKGVGKFYLRVHGRASHAGRDPEKGASANLEMAHKVTRLHALTDFDSGTTVNVGVMRGGERANVVCPEAYAEIDLRAFTPGAAEATIAEMRGIAAESMVPGTTAEFWGSLQFPPLPRKPANEKLFGLVQQVARVVGFEAVEYITGGGSDGNHTGQVVPTMDGMGARGDGAHSDREYMLVDSLVERAQVLALFLERWTKESLARG